MDWVDGFSKFKNSHEALNETILSIGVLWNFTVSCGCQPQTVYFLLLWGQSDKQKKMCVLQLYFWKGLVSCEIFIVSCYILNETILNICVLWCFTVSNGEGGRWRGGGAENQNKVCVLQTYGEMAFLSCQISFCPANFVCTFAGFWHSVVNWYYIRNEKNWQRSYWFLFKVVKTKILSKYHFYTTT